MTVIDTNAKWLDRFFETYYRQTPVSATFIGVHEHDHRLPDASAQAIADMLQENRALQIEGEALNQPDLDVMLALGHLEIQAWELTSTHFQLGNPSWYTGEAVFGVMSLFLREFAPAPERIEAAVSRMRAIPELLAQGRENVRSAHPMWNARAISECDGAIAFFRHGIRLLTNDTAVLVAANKAAQAFESQHSFLTSSLAYDMDADVSAGEETFDMLLRCGHFLDLSAADLLRQAEAQLDESEARLVEGACEFGAGAWPEAIARLQDAHPDVHEYYGQYQQVWEQCRHVATEHELLTWPDYPICYVPRPEWAREAAPDLYFLFYRSPAPFDHVPVVEYLVTPIDPGMPPETRRQLLRAHNDSVIKLNHVVHHGSIGHHVQNWHAFRAESRIGQVAAVDCASRIAMFCGGTMAEGWSSYATELMGEVGFLTPLERYAQHHARLRMAARAIVDIRLHHGELSLAQAAGFYQERVGMSPSAAQDEAIKNSMFPGAAIIYLAGTDMIHDLRRDLASLQGDRFSLQEFHDRFLSFGSIPVSLIARRMKEEATNAE